MKAIVKEIKNIIDGENIPKSFKHNLSLILSIPGIGFLTSVTILAEIGDIGKFLKPKHLVAYFGIDPSVSESGKYKGDKNKISKRGTSFGRRALYMLALASVRNSNNGKPINSVIQSFYKNKLICGKKKKAAIVAVMHKLIKYIFAILREQKEFEIREPQIHERMFLNNIKINKKPA